MSDEVWKNDTFLFRSEKMLTNIYFKMYELKGNTGGETYHTHDYMQIWYVRRGILVHWLNNIPYKLIKGDVIILPPYVVHRIQVDNTQGVIVNGLEFSSRFFNKDIMNFSGNKQSFDFAYLEPFLLSEEIVKPRISLSGENLVTVKCDNGN